MSKLIYCFFLISYGLGLVACSSSELLLKIMNHRQMAGLLGRVINTSQGLYLHRTTQHRNTGTNVHALSGIRTHDPEYERSSRAPQTVLPLDRLIYCLKN
jgi:hypothetical protein